MEAIGALLLIKHELVSGSSVMLGLIFDDALRFFFVFFSFLLSMPHFIYSNGVMSSDGRP